MRISNPRERAFYCVSAQSGLRPDTICKLQVDDVERILDNYTPTPCLIKVSEEKTKGAYSSYFSFCGEESVRYLKDYLKTRLNVTGKSWLFCAVGNENKRLRRDTMSHLFRRAVDKLKNQNLLDFERKFGKPSEVRLYNLRKWFRRQASRSGQDYCNFWMGHNLGVDEHYFPRDFELHRNHYQEKAQPYLRIEKRTPSESERVIEELQSKFEYISGIIEASGMAGWSKEDFQALQEFIDERKRSKGTT